MSVSLNPYLSFRAQAREAMQFYQTVFGGTLDMKTFQEFGVSEDPSEAENIMHAELKGGNGIVFMASDTPNAMEHHTVSNISMSLSGDDASALNGYFEKLSQGGKVGLKLEAAPWGDTFGMVTDKFGIDWMVNILGTQSEK